MAEYYPLLAKAVGSLPNSTSDTRRIVYERARKALIGQLRTYHPPVPDEDIERESLELDRAIERIETELAAAAASPPADAAPTAAPAKPSTRPIPPPPAAPKPVAPKSPGGALGPSAPRKPLPPLRPRAPKSTEPVLVEPKPGDPKPVDPKPGDAKPPVVDAPPADAAEPQATEAKPPAVQPIPPMPPAGELKLPTAKSEVTAPPPPSPLNNPDVADSVPRPRLEPQRPFAPQPAVAKGPKRRLWIVPLVIAIVAVPVAYAAWKLRVTPETITRSIPVQTQSSQDNGKIVDRVGGAKPDESQQALEPPSAPNPQDTSQPVPQQQAETPPAQSAQQPEPAAPQPSQEAPSDASKSAAAPPTANNPELPVAYRAALLVEAPDLPSKVQTFAGTVVWKLNNVNAGPGDAVGLSVVADIDLPDDKMKATVIFEKNSDPSLPASHTIKVRFMMGQGSYSGDVKQINVLQMRREGNSDGEPLAGVTVPVVQNSFLVGLSPGNAESANLRLLAELPWVDIPILLNNGKIAKLTFEKGAAGQRDFNEAVAYWQKQ